MFQGIKKHPIVNKVLTCFVAFLLLFGCKVPQASNRQNSSNNIDQLINQIHSPQNNLVLVAAHRGDWRNAPENSLQGLKNCIALHIDIMETDLKMTKDSVLILMHDKTIDRATNGKGKPEDFTLAEIREFRLKNGLGRPSEHRIPTFREFLEIAKGRILIDVDKGFAYFPNVVSEIRKLHMIDQAIINIDDNTSLDEVEARYGKVADDILLMPVIDFSNKTKAVAAMKSYERHKRTIFQPVWNDDGMIAGQAFSQLKKNGFGIWFNSLWPSLNGGHDDDKAVEENKPDETWGWLVNGGASVIQSDRPTLLLEYLKQRGKHH